MCLAIKRLICIHAQLFKGFVLLNLLTGLQNWSGSNVNYCFRFSTNPKDHAHGLVSCGATSCHNILLSNKEDGKRVFTTLVILQELNHLQGSNVCCKAPDV